MPAGTERLRMAAVAGDRSPLRHQTNRRLDDGRNPGRILPGVLLAFAAANTGRRVSIIGEPIWPGRTSVEYPAYAAHEALTNAVFAERNASILCPYNAVGLDRTVMQDAWRTYPVMIANAGPRPSPWFTDPIITAATFNQPLPAAPPDATRFSFTSTAALVAVRRFITRHATGAGLSSDRVEDLVIAVNELTDNTIEHAGTSGAVTIWNEPGYLVCQVDDGGYLADPPAGRVPPDARTERRRGLILANELCDLVRVHTHRDGTSIHVHMWH
ncbi:sensor histidine kinase [Actinoplanes xinjiangensis]|uniref:sensor histidine kinase n=1 Tax=Actinoplanes xinjiangensis TaxID=512350 RepID=UPI00342340BD